MTPANSVKLDQAIKDFARDLRVDKSHKTIVTYVEAATQYARFASAAGIDRIDQVTTASVRGWLTSLRDAGRSQATIHNRHAGVKALLTWATREHLIESNPMAELRMQPPPAPPIPVLTPDQIRSLIATTEGHSFSQARDAAILWLLVDTGMRRGECAGLKVDDIDTEQDTATVKGKGGRVRIVPFGARTSKAIRRYLRLRTDHPDSHRPELWLGQRGHSTIQPEAILRMVRRRAKQAGLAGIFVHQLRHTWAHQALASGLNEGDVQRLGGWRDRAMLQRYGAAGADERARAAYRSKSFGDRL